MKTSQVEIEKEIEGESIDRLRVRAINRQRWMYLDGGDRELEIDRQIEVDGEDLPIAMENGPKA